MKITPPTALPYSSGPQVNADNRVDADNNGIQPSGKHTSTYSPIVR